jgi:hypothetical protein
MLMLSLFSHHHKVTGKHEPNKDHKRIVACDAEEWQQEYKEQRNCAAYYHQYFMFIHDKNYLF